MEKLTKKENVRPSKSTKALGVLLTATALASGVAGNVEHSNAKAPKPAVAAAKHNGMHLIKQPEGSFPTPKIYGAVGDTVMVSDSRHGDGPIITTAQEKGLTVEHIPVVDLDEHDSLLNVIVRNERIK